MKALLCAAIAAVLVTAAPAHAQETVVEEPTRVSDGVVVVTEIALSVSGERVEHLSPGVSTGVRMTLRNESDAAIREGTLQLEGFGDGVEISPPEIRLDDLGAGEAVRATFTLEVSRQACYEPLGLGASIRDDDALHYIKAEIPAVCPGSKMAFWTVRYEGGDGDDVPEPGEELDVYVTLRNDGRDPGRDLAGTISSPTDGVRIIDGESRWPDAAKGDEVAATDPFRIAIANEVPTAAGCGGMDDVAVVDGDSAATSEASAREGAPPDGAEPVDGGSIEPMPGEGATTEPYPSAGEEPAQEPTDPRAMFELRIQVQGDDTELVADIGSGSICAYQEDAARTGGAGGGDDALSAPEALDGKAAASTNKGPGLFAGALLAAVAGAFVFGRRYLTATQ